MEWRISSRPSASRSVMIASSLSLSMLKLVSTSLPSTFAAQCSACETRTNALRNLGHRYGSLRKFPFRTIRQGNDRHLFQNPKTKARGFGGALTFGILVGAIDSNQRPHHVKVVL